MIFNSSIGSAEKMTQLANSIATANGWPHFILDYYITLKRQKHSS